MMLRLIVKSGCAGLRRARPAPVIRSAAVYLQRVELAARQSADYDGYLEAALQEGLEDGLAHYVDPVRQRG